MTYFAELSTVPFRYATVSFRNTHHNDGVATPQGELVNVAVVAER